MPDTVEKILAGPEYFDCVNLRARLRQEVCIQRQTQPYRFSWVAVPVRLCEDCKQGAKNIREAGGTVPAKPTKPACTILECETQARLRGLCLLHYSKWQQGSLPELGPFFRVRARKHETRPL